MDARGTIVIGSRSQVKKECDSLKETSHAAAASLPQGPLHSGTAF